MEPIGYISIAGSWVEKVGSNDVARACEDASRIWRRDKKEPRPDLNEFDYEVIHDQIALAMQRNVEIKIKRWKEGEFIYNRGTIQWIDLRKRTIEIEDPFRSFELSIDEIVDVTLSE